MVKLTRKNVKSIVAEIRGIKIKMKKETKMNSNDNISETAINGIKQICDLVERHPAKAIELILTLAADNMRLQEQVDKLNAVTKEGFSYLGSYIAEQARKGNENEAEEKITQKK